MGKFYKASLLSTMSIALLSAVGFVQAEDRDINITPDAYAIVGPNNELLSPWYPVQKGIGEPRPQLYNWAVGFDSMAVNLAANTLFTNVYGPAAGARIEGFPTTTGITFTTATTATGASKFYDAPWSINDCSINPVSRGKNVMRWNWNVRWNPNGTYPTASGSGILISIMRFWQGPAINRRLSVYGIAWSSGSAAAPLNFGSYNISYVPSATLGHAELPMSMPYENGWVELTFGTVNGANQIVQVPSPGIATGRFYPMNSPTWPLTPGTNPSDSAPGFYLDDSVGGAPYVKSETNPLLNVANWIMTYAEEEVPGTGTESYKTATLQLEPAISLNTDNDAVYIKGRLVFSDHDLNPDGRPIIACPIQMHSTADPGVNAASRQCFINRETGEFWAVMPLNPGGLTGWVSDTMDIYVGDGYDYDGHTYHHWLRKRVSGIVVAGSTVDVGDIELINGDCDADNEVNLVDLGIISSKFGLANGDAGFDLEADLDHDDEINLVDIGIAASNFGEGGDE